MTAYTITVTDNGDVAAIADGGTATVVVSDGTASASGEVLSVNGHTGVVNLTAADVSADASGAAASAQTAAASYTDATVAALDAAAVGAVATLVAGTNVTVDNTDPQNPVISASGAGGGGGTVDTVVAGTGISVDATDPANPIVTNTGATAAQGALADTATQPGDLATVATTGAYTDLTGTPTLGDAAAKNTGSSAGTVAAGDDSRITGAAQKASNLGDLASSSSARTNLGLGTSATLDVPATGDAGTGQVVKGTDTRLTDARTPTTHTHTASQISDSTTTGRAVVTAADAAAARTAIGAGTSSLALGTTGTTAAAGNDSRLSDSRTPTAHASSHASAGSDPITIAESQVTNLTTDLAAKAPLASPALTGSPTAPTQTAGDNSTKVATTAYVDGARATLQVNAQTGTTYTLALTDAGKFVTMSNASASTLTVPPNSSVAFPVGTRLEGAQLGAGQVTLTAGAGVTVNATPGLKVAAQYGTFGLLKTATDTWLAYGRLSA